METYTKLVFLSVVLVLAIVFQPALAYGQLTMSICRMSKEGMKACLPSVRGTNAVTKPSTACCSALSNADLQCFCYFKNSRLLDAYGIDFNQAVELPAKCKIDESFHC